MKNALDLRNITDEQRDKIERILYPRDRVFSYRFAKKNVVMWKREAKRANFKSLTEWMEVTLNAHTGQLPGEGIEPGLRNHKLSQRFCSVYMDNWRNKAAKHSVSFTEWVERILNDACEDAST